MPRHERLHYPGAIHIVSVKGPVNGCLFYDPRRLPQLAAARVADAPIVRLFFGLIDEARSEHGAIVHGYCICPNDALLTIQTRGAPLTWLMRVLCGRLSQRLHGLGYVPAGS